MKRLPGLARVSPIGNFDTPQTKTQQAPAEVTSPVSNCDLLRERVDSLASHLHELEIGLEQKAASAALEQLRQKVLSLEQNSSKPTAAASQVAAVNGTTLSVVAEKLNLLEWGLSRKVDEVLIDNYISEMSDRTHERFRALEADLTFVQTMSEKLSRIDSELSRKADKASIDESIAELLRTRCQDIYNDISTRMRDFSRKPEPDLPSIARLAEKMSWIEKELPRKADRESIDGNIAELMKTQCQQINEEMLNRMHELSRKLDSDLSSLEDCTATLTRNANHEINLLKTNLKEEFAAVPRLTSLIQCLKEVIDMDSKANASCLKDLSRRIDTGGHRLRLLVHMLVAAEESEEGFTVRVGGGYRYTPKASLWDTSTQHRLLAILDAQCESPSATVADAIHSTSPSPKA